MTAAAFNATQVKKTIAIEAVNNWFIARLFAKPCHLGYMPLDAVFTEVMFIPEVVNYIYDDTAMPAKQARFWIIRAQISLHLKYYIDSKELS